MNSNDQGDAAEQSPTPGATDPVPSEDSGSQETPWQYYISRHDWLSHKFSWHQQHTNERFLDLSGFVASISRQLEPERHNHDDRTIPIPLGFFEVEQPSRIRYAHIVFIFTVLERRARALCRAVRECDQEITIDLKDLGGGTLFERLKTFCDKVAKIPLPNPTVWEGISEFQKVRDCIIHCGGCLRESRDSNYIKKLISQDCGLAESRFGYLQVEERYCAEMEGNTLTFLNDLYSAAHTVIRERLLKRQSEAS